MHRVLIDGMWLVEAKVVTFLVEALRVRKQCSMTSFYLPEEHVAFRWDSQSKEGVIDCKISGTRDPHWPVMDRQHEQEINQCLLKPLRFESFLLLQHSLAHTGSYKDSEITYRKNISRSLGGNDCSINIIAIIVIPFENTMKNSKTFPLCLTKNNFPQWVICLHACDSPWECEDPPCGDCHLPRFDTLNK